MNEKREKMNNEKLEITNQRLNWQKVDCERNISERQMPCSDIDVEAKSEKEAIKAPSTRADQADWWENPYQNKWLGENRKTEKNRTLRSLLSG